MTHHSSAGTCESRLALRKTQTHLAIHYFYNLLCIAAKPTINVTFVKPDGTKVAVKAPVGASMLEVAHANNIDIEGV
jgi:hypothetical protein